MAWSPKVADSREAGYICANCFSSKQTTALEGRGRSIPLAVDPAHKRPLITWLVEHHGWSERRACEALGFSRSTLRYKARPDRDEPVIALLAVLAERFPERGFD
jgi:hypothetical protein